MTQTMELWWPQREVSPDTPKVLVGRAHLRQERVREFMRYGVDVRAVGQPPAKARAKA